MEKRMLSLLLLTCRRGITWTSLSVCLGWLKCIGTDSSMLFSMPRLCSPKHSLNVRQVWPMYWSSIEHGGTSTVFYVVEQFDSMGVRAQFSIWWINILVTLWRYPQRGSQAKKCCFVGPLECKFWSNLMEPLNRKQLSEAREQIY